VTRVTVQALSEIMPVASTAAVDWLAVRRLSWPVTVTPTRARVLSTAVVTTGALGTSIRMLNVGPATQVLYRPLDPTSATLT
jgi:hypothetical protein